MHRLPRIRNINRDVVTPLKLEGPNYNGPLAPPQKGGGGVSILLLNKIPQNRDAKTLENVTLILILKFREFSRITLKRFSVIYCPHSHSQTSRIFENFRGFSKILEVNFSQGCRNRGCTLHCLLLISCLGL